MRSLGEEWISTWSFRDSGRLEEYLQRGPWNYGAVARCIRTGPGGAARAVAQGIHRRLRGLQLDDSRLEVRAMDTSGSRLRDTFPRELGCVLGSARDRIHEAARRVRDTPHVIVVWALGSQAPSLGEQLCELRDAIQSSVDGARLLLVGVAHDIGEAEAFDFRTGLPSSSPLRNLSGEPAALWEDYRRLRVAWEAAGDIERALRWESRAAEDCRVPDDERLERVLTRLAEDEWERVGAAHPGLLERAIARLLTPDPRQGAETVLAEGQRNGLLWQAPAESAWRVAPWVARVRLRTDKTEEKRSERERRLLRWSVPCAPLAGTLLLRCFELENQLRACLGPEQAPEPPPPPACETCGREPVSSRRHVTELERYRGCKPGSAARYYPESAPDRPTGAADFMTLGEFLESSGVRQDDDPTHWLNLLRWLRNSLAHGHRIGWRAICDFQTCLERWNRGDLGSNGPREPPPPWPSAADDPPGSSPHPSP